MMKERVRRKITRTRVYINDYSFSVCEKRLASGWFVYSLIEIKQRFKIAGPISSDIDQSLADYHVQIRDGFYTFWGAHKCDVSVVFISCILSSILIFRSLAVVLSLL